MLMNIKTYDTYCICMVLRYTPFDLHLLEQYNCE